MRVKTLTNRLMWLVAGTAACASLAGDARAMAPPGHFTVDSAAGTTVVDNATGLTWQRGVSPSMEPQVDAAAYCDGLDLGGSTEWRLPAVLELRSLVDESDPGLGPAIDRGVFPGTSGLEFWTSSAGWIVLFSDGSVFRTGVANTHFARCVR